MVVVARVKQSEIVKGFLLQLHKQSCDNLLPLRCLRFQTVRHDVVDVLDKDDVRIDFVEVLYQRAVTSGTEEQRAVGIAERCAVGVGSHGVGRWLLL